MTELHANAEREAEAAECAFEQGKFWEYHNILFENQNQITDDLLQIFADKVGLDLEDFSDCLKQRKELERVSNDIKEGKSLGVAGTPSFFINGKLLVGAQPFSSFKAVIDAELS